MDEGKATMNSIAGRVGVERRGMSGVRYPLDAAAR